MDSIWYESLLPIQIKRALFIFFTVVVVLLSSSDALFPSSPHHTPHRHYPQHHIISTSPNNVNMLTFTRTIHKKLSPSCCHHLARFRFACFSTTDTSSTTSSTTTGETSLFSDPSNTSTSTEDANYVDIDAFLSRGRKRRSKTSPEMRFEMLPIGVVQSPYENKFGVPKQATITARNDALAADGKLQLFPPYHKCITSLEGFDYIWVITLMHLNSGFKSLIKPMPVADAERQPPKEVGLFASRAPHRPNPIALSALRVIFVNTEEGWIEVRGLDLLNDTPILDIKPYIPAFDSFPEAKAGWMDMIRSDANEARLKGYQTIHSPRGARASRAGERLRKQMLQEAQQPPQVSETPSTSSTTPEEISKNP